MARFVLCYEQHHHHTNRCLLSTGIHGKPIHLKEVGGRSCHIQRRIQDLTINMRMKEQLIKELDKTSVFSPSNILCFQPAYVIIYCAIVYCFKTLHGVYFIARCDLTQYYESCYSTCSRKPALLEQASQVEPRLCQNYFNIFFPEAKVFFTQCGSCSV